MSETSKHRKICVLSFLVKFYAKQFIFMYFLKSVAFICAYNLESLTTGDIFSLTVNKNTCPGDKSALHPGGLRIGAPALTSRQFKTTDFEKVADFIDQGIKLGLEMQGVCGTDFKKFLETLKADPFKDKIAAIRKEVEEFASKFPMPGNDIM